MTKFVADWENFWIGLFEKKKQTGEKVGLKGVDVLGVLKKYQVEFPGNARVS